jgi:hypothetical protein
MWLARVPVGIQTAVSLPRARGDFGFEFGDDTAERVAVGLGVGAEFLEQG